METESYTDTLCHTCFDSKNRFSIVSVMLGMTVCFSTLWRFPYQAVNFGGGGFVLIYLVLALLFVYPALTAEWGLGRLTGRGPDGAYRNVNFPGSKLVSVFLFSVVLIIGSYFAVWIGWIARYFISSIFDGRLILSSTDSVGYFNSEVASKPGMQLLFAAIVLLLVAPVILKGQKRIQKVSNYVVPIFYTIVVGMTVLVLAQPGVFSSTFSYLTTVNISQITPYTFVTALGQAFFSLCLGGTFMVLYGSYMDRRENHSIPRAAGYTVVGNSLASIISALLIVGIINLASLSSTNQFGPGLFFGVVPEAFQSIQSVSPFILKSGMAIFFMLFLFAAYLPMTAIIEVTTVGLVDQFHISRRKAFLIVAVATLVLGIPSALSPFAGGFLYNIDIFVGALGLIVGSMIAIYAFTWYVPKERVLEEVNAGSKFQLGNLWYVWTKYVTPTFMVLIILYVLSDVVSGVTSHIQEEGNYVLYENITPIIPVVLGIVVIVTLLLAYLDRRYKLSDRTSQVTIN